MQLIPVLLLLLLLLNFIVHKIETELRTEKIIVDSTKGKTVMRHRVPKKKL